MSLSQPVAETECVGTYTSVPLAWPPSTSASNTATFPDKLPFVACARFAASTLGAGRRQDRSAAITSSMMSGVQNATPLHANIRLASYADSDFGLPQLCAPTASTSAGCLVSALRCLSEERRGAVLESMTRATFTSSPSLSLGGLVAAPVAVTTMENRLEKSAAVMYAPVAYKSGADQRPHHVAVSPGDRHDRRHNVVITGGLGAIGSYIVENLGGGERRNNNQNKGMTVVQSRSGRVSSSVLQRHGRPSAICIAPSPPCDESAPWMICSSLYPNKIWLLEVLLFAFQREPTQLACATTTRRLHHLRQGQRGECGRRRVSL